MTDPVTLPLDIPDRTTCFWQRLADADGMLRDGAWASGHAVASRLLECARHRGCDSDQDCAAAAVSFIGGLRGQVAQAA